jgi:hypothetical protein
VQRKKWKVFGKERPRSVSGARGLLDLLAEFGHGAGGEHAFPVDAGVDDRFAP